MLGAVKKLIINHIKGNAQVRIMRRILNLRLIDEMPKI
jgi:hypothetical protein